MRRVRLPAVLLCLALVVPAVPAAPAAAAPGDAPARRLQQQDPVAPYADPPWRCRFRNYGEGGPSLPGPPDEPLCVRYDKRYITIANGEAVRFASWEPARTLVAVQKCRYWQKDHWVVRVREQGEEPVVVTWVGSYWWDVARAEGALIARRFRIAGEPASSAQAAAFMERFSPELAQEMRRYGARGGGGGMSLHLGTPGRCG